MAASATSSAFLTLPALSPRTHFLRNPAPASASLFSLKFAVNPLRASSDKPSTRFVRRVAVSSDLDQDDFANDGDDRSFSPDLKIFVGNLPFTADSAQLADLFESAGNVEMVEVIYDKETGRSRGFGFVTMSSVEEAKAAAEQFNGYELDGRSLRVNCGPPPPRRESSFDRGAGGFDSFNRGGARGGGGRSDSPHKVYVSNLAWGVDDAALEALFSEQGNVLEAKVVYDRESGRSRGFGFITYGSASEVNSAIESLDGSDMDGRQIRVSQAESRPRRSF